MAWYHRVWNVLRSGRVERDIDHEVSFHLAERVDDLRAQGMSEDEARRKARAQFGGIALQKERTRDADLAGWLEATVRNFRYAARTLAKAPAFTATVVLTLAIGIGANSAVFSAIDAVLLRALPFPDGNRLMALRQSNPKTPEWHIAPVRLEDWNAMNATFEAITGYYVQDSSELSGDMPERLRLALVAPRFLQVWGIAPAIGRDFSPEEEHFGGPPAVLISDRFWRRRFGADPGAIARTLRLGQSSYSIIGIMPASFLFPDRDVDLWSPSAVDAPYAQRRDATWFVGVGRLKPAVTVAQARANLATVQAGLARAYPKTDADLAAVVEPLKTVTIAGVGQSLWMLFGAVTLLLLLTCTNIAALLLSRGAQRRHEIAIRLSLGASRRSVAAQLLAEAFVLAVMGAGLGLLVAAGASTVFRTLAAGFPRVDEIRLDRSIVLYALCCAGAVTLLCGLLPAIRSTRSISGSMAHAGRALVSARHPLQAWLVGAQVALAVTLLAGAGLLLRSFQALGQVNPGFELTHVLTFRISTTWNETADWNALGQWTERILDAVRAVPGVEAAALSMNLPGVPTEYPTELTVLEGRADPDVKIVAESRFVSPSYFSTMRIPLLAGAMCRNEPNAATVVVNRSFANTYFAGSTPIGRHLRSPAFLGREPAEIRGIVADAREQGIDRAPGPTAYWCVAAAQPGAVFLVRTAADPIGMADTLRRKIHEIEPRRSVFDVAPLQDRLDAAFGENRLRTILLASFALTATSLACVGLYGMLSYVVTTRRREVGVRLALGAARSGILKGFVLQGVGISIAGCVAGLALSAASSRVLTGMLFGVAPSDAITLSAVVVIVLTVAAIASLLPAIRAARVEPMQVLRDE